MSFGKNDEAPGGGNKEDGAPGRGGKRDPARPGVGGIPMDGVAEEGGIPAAVGAVEVDGELC